MGKKRPVYFVPYGFGIFALVLFFDAYTKYMVASSFPPGSGREIFSWLWLTYVQNTGILWGNFQGANTGLIWVSVAAFGALLYFHDEFITIIEKICYALLLAGLWGNMLDRIFRGFVVDFIDLGWWPVFNIADAAIVVGIIVYMLEQARKARQNSSISSSLSK